MYMEHFSHQEAQEVHSPLPRLSPQIWSVRLLGPRLYNFLQEKSGTCVEVLLIVFSITKRFKYPFENSNTMELGVSLSKTWKTVLLFILILVISVVIRSEYVREGGDIPLRIDPYYHYRMADTIVKEGHRPEWDYMASWPTGQPGDKYPPLYHYFLAYTFKIFGWLVDSNLLIWCVYSCIIPVVLIEVLAFLVGKELTDTRGGLFCALLFAVMPITVSRTLLGFSDTDGLVLVFSLSACLFWMKSLSESRGHLYAVCSGVTLFLFELTWGGYWHMLFLLLGSSLCVVVLHFWMKRTVDFTKTAYLLLAFLIPHKFYSHLYYEGIILIAATVIFFYLYRTKKLKHISSLSIVVLCLVFMQLEEMFFLPFFPLSTSDVSFSRVGSVFYPYVGPFISQRQPVTLSYVLKIFSTSLVTALLGGAVLLRENHERNYALLLFLILYTAGGAVMSLGGVRHLITLSVPVLLLSSCALSYVWKKLFRGSPGRKVLTICGIALLVVPLYVYAEKTNYAGRPISNEWWEALEWIENNTPEDSVVISDWGNGYWIESIAKRRTIMNGGHYDITWRLLKFGMILQTADENTAVKEIFGFENTAEVENIRNFPGGERGSKLMEKEMTPFAVENQEAYIVIDYRAAWAFNVISYFGTWDYTTGTGDPTYIYAGSRGGTMLRPHWKEHLWNTEVFPVIIFEAEGEYHSFIMKDTTLVPTLGIIYREEGETLFLQRTEGYYGIVWYYPDSVMMLIPSESLDCMLTRLFFFNGEGLRHFELAADFGAVKVYKVYRESQEDLNEGISVKTDEWYPS